MTAPRIHLQTSTGRRVGAVILAFALVFLGATQLAEPAAAGSAVPAESEASGVLKLKLSKKAAKRMRKRGLKLKGGRGAQVRGRTLSLPIAGGEITGIARLKARGALRIVSKPRKVKRGKRAGKRARGAKRFKAGKQAGKRGKRGKRARKRSATLRGFSAALGAGEGHLVATVRGEQVTLLTFSRVGEQPFNPLTGEIDLRRAGAKLTSSAVSAIAGALRGAKLPRRLGRASIRGSVPVKPSDNTNATIRERPAGAADLVNASMTWRARESFVNYIHSARGGDGGAFAVAPAVPGPAELIPPSTQPRVYEFELSFAGGWYDPSSGTVNAELAGGIRFAKPDFGIDLDAIDPVIELGGTTPRVIAHLRGRAATTDQDGRTAIAVDLDQAAVTPQVESVPAGTRYTYEDVPALNPQGPTAWIFATYYPPGSPWGEVTVSYTIPGG